MKAGGPALVVQHDMAKRGVKVQSAVKAGGPGLVVQHDMAKRASSGLRGRR